MTLSLPSMVTSAYSITAGELGTTTSFRLLPSDNKGQHVAVSGGRCHRESKAKTIVHAHTIRHSLACTTELV